MANVGTAYVTIQPTMQGFSKSVSSALNGQCGNLGSQGGSSFISKFQSVGTGKIGTAIGAVAGIASSVATSAFNAIGASMGAAIARVDQLNNFPKVMQNLGYSSDDASRSIQKMSSAIDGLPTSLDTLSGMTQQLAPLCSNLDEATDISIALNNAMLAGGKSSEDVSRAMTQYTQALSKGKPDLMDWRTLQEVMPGQLNQIAQAMLGAGKNSNDLYEALKDGTFSMQDFNNAVLKLNSEGLDGFASFEQQARDSTQGIATALTNVQNRIAKAGETIIQAFGANRISGAINAFSSSFGVIANKLAPAFTVLGNACEGAVNKVSAIAGVVQSKLAPTFDAIKEKVQPVADAITQSFDPIKDKLSNIAQSCGVAFSGFFNQVKTGSLNLQSITATFDVIKTSLSQVFDDTPVQQYVEKVKSKFSELSSAMAGGNFFQALLGDSFNAMPAGLQSFFTIVNTNLQQLYSIASTAKAKLEEVVSVIGEKFSSLGTTIDFTTIGTGLVAVFDGFMAKVSAVIEFVRPIFDTLIQCGQQVAQGLTDAFANANLGSLDFSTIISLVSPLGQISLLIQNFGPQLQELVSGALTTLSSVLVAIMPTILEVVNAVMQLGATVLPLVMSTVMMLLPYVQQIIEFIGQLIQQVMPFITQLISVLVPAIQSILGAIQPLIQAVMNVVTAIMPVLIPAIQTVISIITALIPIISTVISVVASILSVVLNVASVIISAIQPVISFLLEGIAGVIAILANIFSVVGTVISGIVNFLAGLFSAVVSNMGNIQGTIETVMNAIKAVWDMVWGAIKTVAETVWNIITSAIETAINAVKGVIDSVLNTIKGIWDAMWNGISSGISAIWDGIKSGVSSGIDAVYNTITGIKDSICGFFSGAWNWLVDSGKSIIDGLVGGIQGAVSGAVDAVSGVVSSIRDLFPFSPAKKGPFSGHGWVLYSGMSIMNALADGVEKKAGATVRTVKGVMQDISDIATFDAGMNLAYAGAGSLNGGVLQVQGVSDLTSSRDARQINVNLNYSANDDARTMFTDLVTRLETLDRVRG